MTLYITGRNDEKGTSMTDPTSPTTPPRAAEPPPNCDACGWPQGMSAISCECSPPVATAPPRAATTYPCACRAGERACETLGALCGNCTRFCTDPFDPLSANERQEVRALLAEYQRYDIESGRAAS